MALQLGFIGAGGVARAHLSNLERMDDVNVRAVADVDAQRAGEAGTPWGAKPYADCGNMLEAEHLDAVYICLPPSVHGSLELGLTDY